MTPTFHECQLKMQEISEPKISIGTKKPKLEKIYVIQAMNMNKTTKLFALTVNWSNN